MYVNLWLVPIAHQTWILCDQLINEITQEKHHAFILIFLLVDFVNKLLILAKDFVELILCTLLLSLVVQNTFLEELGEVRFVEIYVDRGPLGGGCGMCGLPLLYLLL